MAIAFIANKLSQNILLNAAVSSTGASSAELDLSTIEGPILITLSARTGGTNSMATTVKYSETSGGTFTAVPAAALVNPATGAAATFSAVTTAASTQTLAVKRDLVGRYLRVDLSGASLSQQVTIVAAGEKKYA